MKALLSIGYLMIFFGVFAQREVKDSTKQSKNTLENMNQVAVKQLQESKAQISALEFSGEDVQTRVMSIDHQPQNELNIYLSVALQLAPDLCTVVEVSLSNSGVINLRNMLTIKSPAKGSCLPIFGRK